MKKLLSSLLITFTVVFVACSQESAAQNKNGDIKLVHGVPDVSLMPNPGLPMKLTVRAINTKRTTDPMILVGVKDGEYYEAISKKSYLNERDVAVFEFEIPAPLAELRYRFVLYPSGSEQPIPSQQEVLRRDCIPTFGVYETIEDSNAEGNEQMKKLLVASKTLEQEVAILESAVNAAQDLNSLIGSKD